jgi:hypothetical protein
MAIVREKPTDDDMLIERFSEDPPGDWFEVPIRRIVRAIRNHRNGRRRR